MSPRSRRVRGSPTPVHPPRPGPDGSRCLSAVSVSKSFGATLAVADVSFDVAPGTVHVLLGENGAGKSTLISLLNGRLAPDSGTVSVDGQQLEGGHPERFARHGVATVYQELMLVPSMTGLENIALAIGRAATGELREEVLDLQGRTGLHVELDRETSALELPERQRVELLRALMQRPRYLLLDEPTTFLPPSAIAGFLEQVRHFADDGIGVLFITHRLAEARAIADQTTVVRTGRVVNRYDATLPDDQTLATEIVGREVDSLELDPPEMGAVVLRVEQVSVRAANGHLAVDRCALTVRSGEILGVTGVDGNGQLELLDAIAGQRIPFSGSVSIGDVDVTKIGYRGRTRLGLQYISGERRRHGILPSLSVADHFRYVHGGGITSRVRELLRAHDVSPDDPGHRADHLSGGNQQKMILARALAAPAVVLVLSYPTQGLDVQACQQVRRLLVDEARRGTAIVLATSDLDEALAICHRIAVMNRGGIVGIQDRHDFDPFVLADWFTRDPELAVIE